MNEKEFDIAVRNLLQNAEEEVSPAVWEGVEAGLDKRRRVVPFWRWAGASAAAAAAVAAAVVLLHPAPETAPALSSGLAAGEKVETTIPAPIETPVVPAAPLLASALPARTAPVQTPAVPAALAAGTSAAEAVLPAETTASEEPSQTAETEVPATTQEAIVPAPAPKAAVDDNSLLNRLAFSEKSERRGGRVDLLASANIQGSSRGGMAPSGIRHYAAPPLNAGEGVYNESPESSFRLPFSVGAGIKYNITPHWALGTGIRYTNLGRTFVGDYVSKDGFALTATDIDNMQHWLGVPLNAYYDFVDRGHWRVHAFIGGSAEWLIDNDFLIHNAPRDLHYHQRWGTAQWSATAGLGVEYKITPLFGLYLDPSFRYYFNTERQPRSLRTIQPLRFDLEAGVRFSFGARAR